MEIEKQDAKIIENTLAWAIGILAFQIDGSLGKLPKMDEADKKDAINQVVAIRSVYEKYWDAEKELEKKLKETK